MNVLDELNRKWDRWKQNLPTSVSVPRPIPESKVYVQKMDLHAFGDASKDGVCAAVYSVAHQSSGRSHGLLHSKSRLLKQDLTIPRLKLVASHMSVNLLNNAKKALTGYPIEKLVTWTDSSTALHWIPGNCYYIQFAKNRGDKIRDKKEIDWRYVNTIENPLDVSRGMSVEKMRELRWKGPAWLRDSDN